LDRTWKDDLRELLQKRNSSNVRPDEERLRIRGSVPRPDNAKMSALQEERREVLNMEREFDRYLNDLVMTRLKQTVEFGHEFSDKVLEEYTRELFGDELYFDSLIALAQQYALSDTEVARPDGTCVFRTGFHLALFGPPGTGKTFATKDFILGASDENIRAHGLPGKNRYCGGMTAARFIRIGEAYEDQKYNFIVTEFADWFKYRGMIEPLKIALEQGVIRYETKVETVGPYQFDSFMSVNYNTKPDGKSLKAAISDANFRAIEDRMVIRLHTMTKKRLDALLDSQQRLAMGQVNMHLAQQIRDHLTLVYAIQTEHPLVRGKFEPKQVMISDKLFETFKEAINGMMQVFGCEALNVSARAQSNAIKLATSLALMSYFNEQAQIEIPDTAIRISTKALVNELWARHADTK
jgi:hypothetical protein